MSHNRCPLPLAAQAFAAAALSVVLVLAGAQVAQADNSGDDSTPNEQASPRIVYRTDEMMPTVDAASGSPRTRVAEAPISTIGVILTPVDLDLGTGETLNVVYADGTMSFQSVAAACTVTMGAGNPQVRGGYAEAKHTVSVSAGCTSSRTPASYLVRVGWWEVADYRADVTTQPGWTSTWYTSDKCDNVKKAPWYSQTGAPAVAESATINLLCNG
ncbi:MAG: hypothetical protein AAGC63_15115 [Propionicimonas sp.]|nr:hypothetical protein [Propionicimonas sp.]